MKIKVIKQVMEINDFIAREIWEILVNEKALMINLIGSPGAGKTSFILETCKRLKQCAVIEGDITSDIDAEKIAKEEIPVVQINTGGSCHLSADMIKRALNDLPLENKMILVENVGNLVCPASFEIGEDFKVALSCVTEGDDKPYKYPTVFKKSEAVVLNKIDLLPYLDFDFDYFSRGVKTLNPSAKIFTVSSKTGEGIGKWCAWLKDRFAKKTR